MGRVSLAGLWLVSAVCFAASGQSVRLVQSLPADWEGTIGQAYDIRILDVSDDGRTMVGFVTSTNTILPGQTTGSGGGIYEDLYISQFAEAAVMEPFVIRDGVMRYLPVPSVGGLVSGYANRVSADGLRILGARHIDTVNSCSLYSSLNRKYEAVVWDLAGNASPVGIPDSQPIGISADGDIVLLVVDELINTCFNQWTPKLVLQVGGISTLIQNDVYPLGISDDGTGFVSLSANWLDEDVEYRYYVISGDGSSRFGVSPGIGCAVNDLQMVRYTNGTHTTIGPVACMWQVGSSSYHGDVAIVRSDNLGTQNIQVRIWTEQSGLVSVESFFDQFGLNVRPWVGSPMVLTNMNADASVFVGFLRGGTSGGGTGPDRAIIIDTRVPCPADFAGPDGVLNFFDVAAFLAAYNGQDAAADLAEPLGVWDFFDVAAFLAAYNDGCP